MSSRALACAIGVATFALGSAQVPDLLVHFDVRLTYQAFADGGTAVRWYDNLAHRSTIGLSLNLEPGLKAVVTQRLERIPGDGDPDQIEDYYVEEPGSWRVGKQELPFGPKFLDTENAIAARSDSDFFVAHLPVSVAVCDSGPGRQRGVVARFGGRLGVSFEFGEHFGISATSLAVLRRPEESLGVGAGYRRLLGLDYSKRSGIASADLEFVALRDGETERSANENVLSMAATLAPSKYRSVSLGFVRAFQRSTNILWISGSFQVDNGMYLEPTARYKDGQIYDFDLALRVKL